VAAHPTSKSQHLMTWSVLKGCLTNHEKNGDDNDNTSATDGDLDIALSLFMADTQWGSQGAINYREEGIKRAKAILEFEINKGKHTILLGDANNAGDEDYFDIRSSDFMPAHLKVFNHYYPNDEWKHVIDESYKIYSYIQAKYSPKAGLIPDFIVFTANKFMPAKPKYLESRFDGDYYYNACRVPLRVAVDYLLNNDQRARNMLNPLAEWIQEKTKNNVGNINAGYFLTGEAIPNHKYTTPAFVCPFAIGSMLNDDNQDWVNDCWDYIGDFEVKDYQYFDNTIQMLSLIILSGNYWLP
jgi:endo-1,4-beta-D-glucanase Y